MSLPHRLAAAATSLLALGIVVILGLRLAGAGIAGGPSATASAPPSPAAAASATPSSTPARSEDPLEVFAQIEDQVRDIRGLTAGDLSPPELLTRAKLGDELERIFAEELPPAQRKADNLTLRALGLLGADEDIGELTQQLYEAQVLGFYDFTQQRMVVVTDAGLDPVARITYAHEYTHALQDATFDIGAAREELEADNDDALLARVALEEGDASWSMVMWALEHMPEELGSIAETPLPDMTGIPTWMVRQAEFPYLAGFTFLQQLSQDGFGVDWSAVDAVYDDPPVSTEQILHPEKYTDGEAPTRVRAIELAASLPGAWEEVERTTLGEAMVAIWLEELGAPRADADEAAAGWGGDRLTVLRGRDGGWVLTWRLAWDAAGEADEFSAAYEAASGGPAFTELTRTSPTETVVIHASDDELLAAALAATSSPAP